MTGMRVLIYWNTAQPYVAAPAKQKLRDCVHAVRERFPGVDIPGIRNIDDKNSIEEWWPIEMCPVEQQHPELERFQYCMPCYLDGKIVALLVGVRQ